MSSQLNNTEEQISDLKSRITEINQSEQQTEKPKKKKKKEEEEKKATNLLNNIK